MYLKNWFVVLTAAAALGLASCRGAEEKKEEEKKEAAKKAESAPVGEKAFDKKRAEPAAFAVQEKRVKEVPAVEVKAARTEGKKQEASPEKPAEEKATLETKGGESATAVVEAVLAAVKTGNFAMLADLLPASYAKDIDGLVQDFAKGIDKELFDKFVVLADRVVAIAVKQKDQLAQMIAGFGLVVSVEDLKKGIDGLAQVWGIVKDTGVTDLEKLQRFTITTFTREQLPKLTDKLFTLIKAAGPDEFDKQIARLNEAKIQYKGSLKDEKWGEIAQISVTIDGDTESTELVQVEGKWVPKELAEKWQEAMEDARRGIKEMAEKLAKNKTEILAQISQIEPLLDHVEKTGDLSILQQFIGGTMMGGAPPIPAQAPAPEAAPAPKPSPVPKATPAAEAPPAPREAPTGE